MITVQGLQERFADCDDICISTFPAINDPDQPWVVIIYNVSMCDSALISKVILPVIHDKWTVYSVQGKAFDPSELKMQLSLDTIKDEDALVDSVFSGDVALYFPSSDKLYSFNAATNIGRSPEESSSETSIKGPKDGFVEELDTNVALIRKRMKTTDLVFTSFELGDRSKTSIGIMYLKDKVIPETVKGITKKLHDIKGDSPTGIGELAERLSPYRYSVLPMFDYTGRPDRAYDSLTRGRLIIIMQGSPVVLIAPASLMQLLFATEDTQMPYYYVFPWRLLRLLGFLISIMLPGFYITIVSFHQDQIPFPLLATIANTRLGLPIPTGFEMLIILFLLTLLREAGIRMPSPIASTITVVSGIIIGDAAIRGGFFSPTMTVIGALSFVAGSTHTNEDFVVTQTIMRYFILGLSAILGLFGFFVSVFFIVQYMAHHRPFGQPFLAPFSPFSLSKVVRNLMRLPDKRKKGGAI
ncbi:spore germination protein [Paenibacillus lactis]|uniref:GerA spore germination protein n=1 Tax=Paenibacillus lactis 154 TaxID=743719 RepID=G4HB94_9BACL|nr:spore germination protein [Paenibacillus lactis]EHB67203.1 GerA spore germination protein [Paenibacillus lactis 154]